MVGPERAQKVFEFKDNLYSRKTGFLTIFKQTSRNKKKLFLLNFTKFLKTCFIIEHLQCSLFI